MFGKLLLSLGAALVLWLQPAALRAGSDFVEVSILPGWRMADGSHMAALRFTLADGWKTYWRAPGEAGIPPRFDWRGSRNLAAVSVEWPTPHQTTTNGLRTLGYERELVLPLRLTPIRAGQPIRLAVEMEIGVCNDICVPITTGISGDLPLSGGAPDPRIAASLAARPYTADEAGVGRVACRIIPAEGGLRLVAEIDMPAMGRGEFVVIETDNPELWVEQAASDRRGNRLRSEVAVYHAEGRGFLLNRAGLRLTVFSSGDAVDIRGCPAG